jgi:hypothetical protein
MRAEIRGGAETCCRETAFTVDLYNVSVAVRVLLCSSAKSSANTHHVFALLFSSLLCVLLLSVLLLSVLLRASPFLPGHFPKVIAYDKKTGKLLPFQVLSTRAKKNADEDNLKVHVIVLLFDLLYLNGKSMLQETLLDRRAALRTAFNVKEGEVELAKSLDCTTSEEIQVRN